MGIVVVDGIEAEGEAAFLPRGSKAAGEVGEGAAVGEFVEGAVKAGGEERHGGVVFEAGIEPPP